MIATCYSTCSDSDETCCVVIVTTSCDTCDWPPDAAMVEALAKQFEEQPTDDGIFSPGWIVGGSHHSKNSYSAEVPEQKPSTYG